MTSEEIGIEESFKFYLLENDLKSDNLINRGLWMLHFKYVRKGVIEALKAERKEMDNKVEWLKGEIKKDIKFIIQWDGSNSPQDRLRTRILDSIDKTFKKKEKTKVVILDNNPLSINAYAEEYPENWERICKATDKAFKGNK